MGENPHFSRFVYILNPQKHNHNSYSNTQKIFMDIFLPVVVKKNHHMQEKQRIECDSCGMWEHLECLEDVLDANWFCSYSCRKLDDVA